MSLETSPLVLAAQKYLGNEVKAAKVLEYFEFISSIPHISGHEAQLASRLIEWANENNLAARMDKAGNVWIVRAPDVTCEEEQEIILQGHLDMVADKLDDNDFDFIKSGIPLEVTTDGYIKSKANTSLGADNGIGVALAMAILTDKTIKTGKITALFTVSEETGLVGAKEIKKEDLPENAWLINLDSEGITIGCAGGVTISGDLLTDLTKEPITGYGYKIEISGLLGGHSGCDIDKNRGNAIIAMLEFLKTFPQLYINGIYGGTLPNVIPSSCKVICVAKEDLYAELLSESSSFASTLNEKLELPENTVSFSITKLEEDSFQCFTKEYFSKLLKGLLQLPHGVKCFNSKFNCVENSCNFASISTDNGDSAIDIYLHPRSMDNASWSLMAEDIKNIISSLNGKTCFSNEYSGWMPKNSSKLCTKVKNVYQKFGLPTTTTVTHGGLECGCFALFQPSLDIISIGPDKIYDIHTYKERVHLTGIEEFWPVLQTIVDSE